MTMQSKQQGVVLVVGLLMLLLLTIIGVSAMSSTANNERTAGNNQFATVSFQAAESAVKSLFTAQGVQPTVLDNVDGLNDKKINQTNNYDVDLDNVGTATVAVQAIATASFCGGDPIQINTTLASGSQNPGVPQILVYDVEGDSQISGAGARENHLRSGSRPGTNLGFMFNGAGTAGDCLNP